MPRPNASAVSRQPPPLTKLHLTSIAAQPIKSKANVPIRSEMYFRYESINRQLLFIYLSAKRLPFTDRREAPSSIDAGGIWPRMHSISECRCLIDTRKYMFPKRSKKAGRFSFNHMPPPKTSQYAAGLSQKYIAGEEQTEDAGSLNSDIIKPVRSDIFAMRILSM